LGTRKLGDDADNVQVDGRANQVVIGYGKGALAMLDAASGAKTGEVSLTGHPESFQLEPNGRRIFVNVPDARQIAVVDRATSKQVAKWRVRDEGANFPMAVDHTGERLAVVYRKPALLAVLDTNDGHVAARLPTCGDADDVFFDAKRQRIYISCGEGALAVGYATHARFEERRPRRHNERFEHSVIERGCSWPEVSLSRIAHPLLILWTAPPQSAADRKGAQRLFWVPHSGVASHVNAARNAGAQQ
jgi:hypothetical protein